MNTAIATGHMPHLFCFGLGYSALALASRLISEGWEVSGTCRQAATGRDLSNRGIRAFLFDREHPFEDPSAVLSGITDVLISVPPDSDGDPVLDLCGTCLEAMPGLRWIGYLSTTGVYGDTGGALVDESAPLNPTSERGRRRQQAEQRWLALNRDHGRPVHVFRLAGIYGPGRSAIDQVRAGKVMRVEKPGHLFSRIHVADIAMILRASMAHPIPGAIYNVCDDVPASQSDVVAYACELLGIDPPAPISLQQASKQMSEMALSFWRDNRLVDNRRVKADLGIGLQYPDYRSGLNALAEASDTPPEFDDDKPR